ncbi:MAG TPA: neutral/alkaline non-lysosomal ceramidase N-terminal domain-containing protein, partial [Enhygromyxa sp.]|nr:neutral/alkaline non-lysosomal ceramidase N-terminal domain-containing protein [Enhygromyxa sp.]
MRSMISALLLVLSVLAASCATPPARPAEPITARPLDDPRAPREGALLAGAAKIDITPMPGLPLGGHSIEGGIGYGVWTRLWARAIYLEDQRGEPLVLVATDLWSIPAGLADAVIVRLHDHHRLTHIGRGQLLLAATHTHHSPANFSSSILYNRAASTMMGFDPDLHDFLVRRIAQAIASATTGKLPARLSVATSPVALVARNRSTAPFAQNPEAPLLLAANAELPSCPEAPVDADTPDIDPCRAIDPTLTTVRLDGLDGRPLAIAAFFAVHATSMVNATDAYNGDLFAVATARAEAALVDARTDLGDPVVALFNGPEGDVSPNWVTQGRADALELGTRLGDAIVDAAALTGGCVRGHGREIEGEIESRFARVSVADQPVAGPPNARTAARALPGKSVLGGAEDGRTRFFERLPEGQTVERSRRDGQGTKRPAVPPGLYSLLFPASTIPNEVPLSVHRIGPLTIAGLPGEFTTIMGMRIRSALAERLPEGGPRPILVGLAGEYLSYFVTPQEYALQHYEGASTMWGQYAGVLIQERLAALLDGPSELDGEQPRHRPGMQRRFALHGGARTSRALRDLDRRLAAQLGFDDRLDTLPRIELDTRPPSWSTAIWPSLRVEVLDDQGRWLPFVRDGVAVDERGVELLSFPLAITRDRWTFAVLWIGEVPTGRSFRLRGYGPDG